MTTAQEEARAATIAAAKAKLADALQLMEQPAADAFEHREQIRRRTRPGRIEDEQRLASADTAWWQIENFTAKIRAAIASAP